MVETNPFNLDEEKVIKILIDKQRFMTANEIAEVLNKKPSRPTVAKILEKLEKRGLLDIIGEDGKEKDSEKKYKHK